ncbi:hypothetical protein DsansV1_C18g0150851 [Dioscorea sansibarensis]
MIFMASWAPSSPKIRARRRFLSNKNTTRSACLYGRPVNNSVQM